MARVVLAFLLVVAGFPVIILLSGAHDAWLGALRVASVTAISVLGPGVPGFIYFRCRGWWRPWQFVAGGVLGGLLSAFVFVDAGAANFRFLRHPVCRRRGPSCAAVLVCRRLAQSRAYSSPAILPARRRRLQGRARRAARHRPTRE